MKVHPWQALLSYVFFCIYLMGGSLTLNSREVADYSLAKSIVSQARFDIPFIPRTGDLAQFNGKYFLDRGPGNALISIPIYLYSRLIWPGEANENDASYFSMRFAAAFISAIGILLFLMILTELRCDPVYMFLATIALAIGSIRWRYSTIFYSHISSSALLLLSIFLFLLLSRREPGNKTMPFVLGFVLGLNVLVEFANALLVPIFILFALLKKPSTGALKESLWIILGGLGPLLFLLFYNWSCFESPFSTGFSHQIYFDYNKTYASAFSTPILTGLPGMIFSIRYQGFLYASPIYLFGIAGLPFLWKKERRLASLVIACFVVLLLFYSKYRVWWGATSDTRYLLPTLPLLLFGLPYSLKYFLSEERTAWVRASTFLLFSFLLVRSILWSFISVASFYDHPFQTPDLIQILLLNDPPKVLSALKSAFPSHVWALPALRISTIGVLMIWGALAIRSRFLAARKSGPE